MGHRSNSEDRVAFAGSLVVIARDDSTNSLSPRGDKLPPGYGISSWILRTGRAFRTTDVFAQTEILLTEPDFAGVGMVERDGELVLGQDETGDTVAAGHAAILPQIIVPGEARRATHA